MKAQNRIVKITLASARAYSAAARILKDKLGAEAPDFEKLIRRELENRDPEMIADEYLEANHARRVPSKRAVRTVGNGFEAHPRALSAHEIVRGYSAVNPTCN